MFNRHRISPMHRNRVKKPESESNHRMTICQWQVVINILRHSRRFFKCACKALLPAAP
ncbi:hypothetical protein GMM85_23750 [Escherichia coli]|nr:hypothetical protein [Escherichia coli]